MNKDTLIDSSTDGSTDGTTYYHHDQVLFSLAWSRNQMQHKLNTLDETSQQLGLNILSEKTTIMRLNQAIRNLISHSETLLIEVESYICLSM